MTLLTFPFGRTRMLWSGCTLLFLLGFWQLCTSMSLVPILFLPTPAMTLAALSDLLLSGRFSTALMISGGRILAAILGAVFIGSFVGILTGISPLLESLLLPVAQPLRYVPMSALVPLLVLWLGTGERMKIAFLFIAIVFYFIPLVQSAIASVPKEYIEVARSFGAGFPSILFSVHIPHALPRIFDGLIVINAIGWNYVVLAEIVNAKDGLGYLLYIAGRLQRSDEVIAGLILIALVAALSEGLLRFLRKRYFFW